jgi:ABC-type multidrug transport system ATPase subunit
MRHGHSLSQISGKRYANGMEIMDRPSMSSMVGYLPQFDLYIGTLTVREHLEFLVSSILEEYD